MLEAILKFIHALQRLLHDHADLTLHHRVVLRGRHLQCDQIDRFLKLLRDKLFCKSSPFLVTIWASTLTNITFVVKALKWLLLFNF